jgi:hypothetical protein
MVRLVLAWWRASQRRFDVEILWPACKAQAGDLEYARAVFAVHAFSDPAWLSLGEAAIFDLIEGLQ